MQDLKIKNVKKLFGEWDEITIAKYSNECELFFKTLSSVLSDTASLNEIIFAMSLLLDDLENGKCGFHNSSETNKLFKRLKKELDYKRKLPIVISFIPKYIDEKTNLIFSQEFHKIYGEAILGKYGIEEQENDYGYIEVDKDEIDISNKDKAEVLAGLYNNSHPVGMGMLHYDPTPMTIEVARETLEKTQNFGYLKGRPLKINLEDNIVYVGAYNRDNRQGLAQQVISNCKNINEIGQRNLKKFEDLIEIELKKQIENEIAKKQTDKIYINKKWIRLFKSFTIRTTANKEIDRRKRRGNQRSNISIYKKH